MLRTYAIAVVALATIDYQMLPKGDKRDRQNAMGHGQLEVAILLGMVTRDEGEIGSHVIPREDVAGPQ